jgi:hypothetical protein
MGLAQTIIDGVNAAFNALDDIPEEVTFHYYTTAPSYSPTTTTLPAPDAEIAIEKAIVLEYKKREVSTYRAGVPIPTEIRATDRKVLIRASEFGDVEPHPKDKIERSGGEMWSVVSVKRVPANNPALYILQIRRP